MRIFGRNLNPKKNRSLFAKMDDTPLTKNAKMVPLKNAKTWQKIKN